MKMVTRTLILLTLLFSQQALCDVMSPADVTASSTFDSYSLPDLINESGISGGLDGGTHGTQYGDMWMSDNGDATPWVIFDTGSSTFISNAHVWNYNATCCGLDRGVDELDVYHSDNDVDYTFTGNFNLQQSAGGGISAEVLSLNVTARYIRFNVVSNHGDPDYTGLSEVAFDVAGSMPTPEMDPVPVNSFWMISTLLLLMTVVAVRRLRKT